MTRILIAGAGPVGLWLAAELRLREIEVVVVDPRPERSPYSKALTIHPRTLEVFAQRGVIDGFLARGLPIPSGHFGALEQKLDFRPLDTPYPFTLLFPQADTEELLERRARDLGVDLRRGHRLIDVEEGADGIVARIAHGDDEYRIEAAYLAGCDGAGSTVRKRAGIAFPGTDASTFGILADVTLAAPPETPLYGYAATTGQLMIVPLPSGGHRIVGVDPARQQPASEDYGFEEFRASVVAISGTDYGMHSPTWVSRFGNASRVAERYSRGRIALAGDAAHMHFPAGGVGMNVGIQDAHALGWRLADIALGLAPQSWLDDYHDERHAVGVDLVRGTQAQTAILAAFDEDRQALRALLDQLIAEVPELSLALAERLSGLRATLPPAGRDGIHPAVGRRLSRFDASAALVAAGRSAQPVLIDPHGASEPLDAAATASGVARVAASEAPPLPGGAAAALIRPDGRIAWATDAAAAGPAAIERALQTLRPAASVR